MEVSARSQFGENSHSVALVAFADDEPERHQARQTASLYQVEHSRASGAPVCRASSARRLLAIDAESGVLIDAEEEGSVRPGKLKTDDITYLKPPRLLVSRARRDQCALAEIIARGQPPSAEVDPEPRTS